MAAITIEELKEEIRLFPDQYRAALERQTQTILEVAKLDREIDNLKKELASENNAVENEDLDDADDDISLLKLETEVEKLRLELHHTECSIELNARKSPDRVTESTVKAMVTTDEQIHQMRKQLIDEQAYLKVKKLELNRQKQERREKERDSRFQMKTTSGNEELEELENKKIEAQNKVYAADDEVEILKVKLETYRLIAGIQKLEDF